MLFSSLKFIFSLPLSHSLSLVKAAIKMWRNGILYRMGWNAANRCQSFPIHSSLLNRTDAWLSITNENYFKSFSTIPKECVKLLYNSTEWMKKNEWKIWSRKEIERIKKGEGRSGLKKCTRTRKFCVCVYEWVLHAIRIFYSGQNQLHEQIEY